MMTDGFPALLGTPIGKEAALAIEAFLKDEVLLGVNGPKEVSILFREARSKRGVGVDWVPGHSAVCYEASADSLVASPLLADESVRWLRGDSDEDLALCERIMNEFAHEIHVLNASSAGALAARRLKENSGKFMVLERNNGDVCAFVASMRSTPRYGVITGVFTDQAYRRKGCARRAVSAMGHALLKEKERLALFADADNVGPNALYVSLGFTALSTMQLWELPAAAKKDETKEES